MMRQLTMVGVALALLCAPISAGAQDRNERARKHYERGQRLYERGDYEEAADELRRAYALVPRPMLLYNLAMAQWRSGQFDRAVTTADAAIESGLPGEMDLQMRARAAAFRSVEHARELASDIDEAPPIVGESPPVERARSGGVSARGWAGLLVGAAGLGAIGGAVVVDRQLAADAAAFEDTAARGDRDEYETRLAELERRQNTGRMLLVAGLAAATTGATLLLVDLATSESTDRPAETARIGAALVPGGGGAVLRLTFH